jgi:hypothetical protein
MSIVLINIDRGVTAVHVHALRPAYGAGRLFYAKTAVSSEQGGTAAPVWC